MGEDIPINGRAMAQGRWGAVWKEDGRAEGQIVGRILPRLWAAAGSGGAFDVCCRRPLYTTLLEMGLMRSQIRQSTYLACLN